MSSVVLRAAWSDDATDDHLVGKTVEKKIYVSACWLVVDLVETKASYLVYYSAALSAADWVYDLVARTVDTMDAC